MRNTEHKEELTKRESIIVISLLLLGGSLIFSMYFKKMPGLSAILLLSSWFSISYICLAVSKKRNTKQLFFFQFAIFFLILTVFTVHQIFVKHEKIVDNFIPELELEQRYKSQKEHKEKLREQSDYNIAELKSILVHAKETSKSIDLRVEALLAIEATGQTLDSLSTEERKTIMQKDIAIDRQIEKINDAIEKLKSFKKSIATYSENEEKVLQNLNRELSHTRQRVFLLQIILTLTLGAGFIIFIFQLFRQNEHI